MIFEQKRDETKTMVYTKPENPGFSWPLTQGSMARSDQYCQPP